MIAINQEFTNDPFYRYKMPPILIKKEVNKTVLLNLSEISSSLNTEIEYLMKFLSEDLGTNVSNKNEKIILNGLFENVVLQKSIYSFINKFILCKYCGNPETEIYLKKDYLKNECKACGKKFKIEDDSKTYNFILKKFEK